MIRKCQACAHDTCEGYANDCDGCVDHSEWTEAAFVQEIRREEQEACAKICDAESEMYLQQNLDAMRNGRMTHEHVEHSRICKGLARKIRGEK